MTITDETLAITGPDDIAPATLPATPEEWDGFTITDDETLSRILRAIRSVQRKRDRIRALVQPEIDRLEMWAADEDAPLRERAERLEAAARDYALARRTATEGRVKSIGTPFGSVQTREAGGGWEIADVDAVLAWASENAPELVKVARSLDLAGAKRQMVADDDGTVVTKGDGEVVPGLKAKPRTLTAQVAVAAPEPVETPAY